MSKSSSHVTKEIKKEHFLAPARYEPVIGTDLNKNLEVIETAMNVITAMKEFGEKSIEELRLEDYTFIRKKYPFSGKETKRCKSETDKQEKIKVNNKLEECKNASKGDFVEILLIFALFTSNVYQLREILTTNAHIFYVLILIMLSLSIGLQVLYVICFNVPKMHMEPPKLLNIATNRNKLAAAVALVAINIFIYIFFA